MLHKVKVALTIYGYEREGKMVYVGQTRVPLQVRDKQHRVGKETEFDRDYGNHLDLYGPPIVLALMIRTHHFSNDMERATAMNKWQIWTDKEEIYYIMLHGTFLSSEGYNMTKGGQGGGRNVAFFQSQLKKSERKWTKTYMPMFRSIDEGKRKCLWRIPKSHKGGGLINSVRTGLRSIPYKYVLEMQTLGFEEGRSVYESRWIHDYMPMFRSTEEGRRKCIWRIPYTHKLGRIISDLRYRKCSIPCRHVLEMQTLGFEEGRSHQESRWIHDYLPAMRNSVYGREKRLWQTPYKHVEDGIAIGEILKDIHREKMSLPVAHLPELEQLGYYHGRTFFSCNFEFFTMPALRDSIYGQENRLAETPSNYEHNGVCTGQILCQIRHGRSPFPLLFREELSLLGIGPIASRKRKGYNDDDIVPNI
jgi:hypothetical protein